ncbi:cyclophilin-like protein [Hesseltinella vesiculosa]|uniref:Peptidyl-prolyl isomerase CWC27 n=1 Tax=Hesseltinella vesiculosa TaxID=101127 RepID=A0A1X2GUP9_9FUNG|nr:cyclophilin-like protein [Hesseltinella vesiculosa]
MSNIYALEPYTNGKVILKTTKGDVEIELWGKEAPKATRNFIQLCLEGYYDDTIFHRVVPGFIVQGGDPTGTGFGGESIYEDSEFPDEFHSRLRFNRRGLVGMANTGQNDNGSQFFFTLDRSDDLTKKHTLFGRVAGDTLFNVMKMAELEIDKDNRPLYPPKIKSTEVVINPFDDIVPRVSKKELLAQQERERLLAEAAKPKKVKKEKKRLNLLSFGEEAEEMSPETTKKKMKSAHDDMEGVPAPAPLPPSIEKELERLRQEKAQPKPEAEPSEMTKPSKPKKEKASIDQPTLSAKEQIEILKRDIKQISKVEEKVVDNSSKKKVSLVQQEREKYAKSGKVSIGGMKARKRKGMSDDDTMARLMAFQDKLTSTEEAAPLRKKENGPCALHGIPGCESCESNVGDLFAEDDSPDNWMAHKLVFEKDLKGKDLMQRKENVNDYVVFDPLDKNNQEQDPLDASYSKRQQNDSRRSSSHRSDRDRHDDYQKRRRDDDRRSRYDDRDGDYRRRRDDGAYSRKRSERRDDSRR